MRKPDKRLESLGKLYKERNKQYGNAYMKAGRTLKNIFPKYRNISENEWGRIALVVLMVVKITRYGNNIEKGHEDSLKDLSVYAQMAAHYDEDNNL